MAMTIETTLDGLEVSELWRVSKPQYISMHEQGFFNEKRVELVWGMVVAMAPADAAHANSVRVIRDVLYDALKARAMVFDQAPFDATEHSMPEPDVFVTPTGSYWEHLPKRAYLVVEVSRSSARYDRKTKASLYARAEIDEYWVVDHNTRTVIVHRNRADIGWATVLTFGPGQTISPVAFPDVQIAVDEILPPQG